MSRNRKTGACAVLMAFMVLTGCGQAKAPNTMDATTIVLSDKGALTVYLVNEFGKEYYDISGLASMAAKEAAEYNTEKQKGEKAPITVEKVEALEDADNKVLVTYKYDSPDTYMDFWNFLSQRYGYTPKGQGGILFYGTVKEAQEKGYDPFVSLKSVKDGTALTREQLLQNPDKHLVITDVRALIHLPVKPTHLSEGAIYNKDGSVDTLQAEGTVTILLK